MRILYMGTDKFAVPSLIRLAEEHEVVGVVTQPDKPRGRGKKISPTPVKEAAERLNIPVFQPKSLKSEKFKKDMEKLNFDLVVAVAYGKLIPPDFISKPPKGCICLHPSKLPEYRGCSPIECAILDGKETTGISVFFIEKEFDTGDIIYREDFEIKPDDTGGSLRERMSNYSPDILLKVIRSIEKGDYERIPQDVSCDVYYAPKFNKEDGLIDWQQPAEKIRNRIRAFNPKPGAFTYFRGNILKVLKSEVIQGTAQAPPGTIMEFQKNKGFVVACGKDSLLLNEVQPAGKNPMTAWAFVLGYHPKEGEILGKKDTAETNQNS